jgi:hypothetical protein
LHVRQRPPEAASSANRAGLFRHAALLMYLA